jgi:D-serine deaminase-like pyridoxal phosphate-dependent protein
MAALKADLETPALLLDMNAMEQNLARMAAFFRDGQARLRPHFKNHRCLALTRRQLEAGAIGITCATVRKAQVLVEAGVSSILIANEIAGPVKIARFTELSQRAEVIVAVDHIDTIRELAQSRLPLNVVVDIDIGLGRCGVRSAEDALFLARQAIANGLVFRGLMGYEGRIGATAGCDAALQKLIAARRLIEADGIPVEVVSAGGTGSYARAGRYPGVTEVQAGSYIVMDTDYHALCPDFDPVLTVLATVISKTERDHFVVDAGLKSLSSERGMPSLKDRPGALLRKLNAEHGIIDILDPALPVNLGEQVEIRVHYGDATVNLHQRMYGVRGDSVEEVFCIQH